MVCNIHHGGLSDTFQEFILVEVSSCEAQSPEPRAFTGSCLREGLTMAEAPGTEQQIHGQPWFKCKSSFENNFQACYSLPENTTATRTTLTVEPHATLLQAIPTKETSL